MPNRLLKVVCPSTPKDRQFAVHVFSEEWFGASPSGEMFLQPPRPPSFLLEFVGRESGVAALNWLEISRSKSALLQQLHTDYPDTVEPPGTSYSPIQYNNISKHSNICHFLMTIFLEYDLYNLMSIFSYLFWIKKCE